MSKKYLLAIAIMAMILAGCGQSTVLVRSDPPINGMEASVQYTINATPDGKSEINRAVYQGVNAISPLPLLTTTYGRGAGVKTQTVQATGPNGTAANVLGMTKRTIKFGLTEFLVVDAATYDMRDANGDRVCGAKIRMTFQPSLAQRFLQDHLGGGWDALWYYSVPCQNTAEAPLELQKAKLIGLAMTQVLNIRLTGKPVLWNRGHSVTIVGGAPERFPAGWWVNNVNILKAAALIRDLSHDLNSGNNHWLRFTPGGRFAHSKLVYSAGDADVYNLRRFILNRQSDYVVHFRSRPSQPWHIIIVHPIYNFEWNDLRQNWHALKGQAFPNVDDKVDKDTGLPKDITDKEVKEIETVGCQNCPNAALEQLQFRDGSTGDILYAMTIRGYLGANSSLVMFGSVPKVSLGEALKQADAARQEFGYDKSKSLTSCPVQRDEDGKRLPDNEQISQKHCAELLREGALWDLITQDPNKFGFDVVGQFQVKDSSTWHSQCTGSGEYTNCVAVADDQKLDASYLFNRTDDQLRKAWTVMQLLGEVGVRTLGMSYVSYPGAGSGLLFGMEQPMMYRQYFSGISNSEMVFAFDARALQLPQTLAAASTALYGDSG